jgi:hypothetical protein
MSSLSDGPLLLVLFLVVELILKRTNEAVPFALQAFEIRLMTFNLLGQLLIRVCERVEVRTGQFEHRK